MNNFEGEVASTSPQMSSPHLVPLLVYLVCWAVWQNCFVLWCRLCLYGLKHGSGLGRLLKLHRNRRQLFLFSSLLWWPNPQLVTNPVAWLIGSWSTCTKMLSAAVLFDSTIHHVGSWHTVLSDLSDWCSSVATRKKLHPDLISWLENNMRFSYSPAVTIIRLALIWSNKLLVDHRLLVQGGHML